MASINTNLQHCNDSHDVPSALYQLLCQVARLGYEPNNIKDWYDAILRDLRGTGDENADALYANLTPSSDRSSTFSSDYQNSMFNSPVCSNHGQTTSSTRSPKLGSIPEKSLWLNSNASAESVHAQLYCQSPQQITTKALPVQSSYRTHPNASLSRHCSQSSSSEQASPQRCLSVRSLQSPESVTGQQGYDVPRPVLTTLACPELNCWSNLVSKAGNEDPSLGTPASVELLPGSGPWFDSGAYRVNDAHTPVMTMPATSSAPSPEQVFLPNATTAPILRPYELSPAYRPNFTTNFTPTDPLPTVPLIPYSTPDPVRVFGFTISKTRTRNSRPRAKKVSKPLQGGSGNRRNSR